MGKSSKSFAKKLWKLERPYLDNVLYHKGFKKNIYPKGSSPPLQYASKSGLMRLYNRVETKIPAKGHVRRYRREHESSKPLPPGLKPGSTKPMTKLYKTGPGREYKKTKRTPAPPPPPPPPPPTPPAPVQSQPRRSPRIMSLPKGVHPRDASKGKRNYGRNRKKR